MGLLSSIANLASGGILGGITGLIGSAVSSYSKYKLTKLNYQHQVDMERIKQDTMRVSAETGIQIQQAKTQGQVELANIEARKASYEQSNKDLFNVSYMQYLPKFFKAIIAMSFAFVDSVKHSVRPFLAYLFTMSIMILAYISYQKDATLFYVSGDKIVITILYLTTTAITWWYSDRSIEKHIVRLFDQQNHPVGQWYEDKQAETNLSKNGQKKGVK